ncbi:MAG: hypothetical protein HUJ52_01555, partial [Malacoplasma sp.]|nr:hypothetical protein [Malacoplasma sp.]
LLSTFLWINPLIKAIAFDRGGNLYHGQVKALADEARKNGLKF